MARMEVLPLGHRRARVGALAALLAGGGAVAAALATGPTIGGLNSGVEAVSSASSTFLSNVATALPLGFAFGAGMVAAVNPCGFALLPAYLGLYLGAGESPGADGRLPHRLGRALWVSATVTAAFVLLFAGAGLVLSLAASVVARYLPWVGLAVGVLLLAAGGRLLGGGALYTGLGERVADAIGARVPGSGTRAYFVYGLVYATASLSCTLPIFLTVVASTLAVEGLVAGALQFVLYGLGMGSVIAALTLSVALFKHAVVRRVRGLTRHVHAASAVLLLLAGAYIVYYWLTLGSPLLGLGVF